MNAYELSLKLQEADSRTRRVMGVSAVVHALIILWLLLYRTIAPPPPALTEITWIDPVTIQPPAAKVTVTEPVRKAEPVKPSPQQKPGLQLEKPGT